MIIAKINGFAFLLLVLLNISACERAGIATQQLDAGAAALFDAMLADTIEIDAGPQDHMVLADSSGADLGLRDQGMSDIILADSSIPDQQAGDLAIPDASGSDLLILDSANSDQGTSLDVMERMDAGEFADSASLVDALLSDVAVEADASSIDAGCADDDFDGVCNDNDICPNFDDHRDADQDGTPDGCDTCPYLTGSTCPADLTCNSCASCSASIQSASAGQTVRLTQDVQPIDSTSSCIDLAGHSEVVFDCDNHTLTDTGTTYYGVYSGSGGVHDVVVANCRIKGFRNDGISMINGQNNLISGCVIEENGTGINFYSVDNSHIADNLIRHNSTAVQLRYDADNNLIQGNSIVDNYTAGISLTTRLDVGDPDNNRIYDNYFRSRAGHSVVVKTTFGETREQADFNIFSEARTCNNVNLLGCPCTGGNYWASQTGNGFSETCSDTDQDGFCDAVYDFTQDSFTMRDLLPLSIPPGQCCANPDKDHDGYSAVACGGNDCDDEPWQCGAQCNLTQPEQCDNFDNNCNNITDGSAVCSGDVLKTVSAIYPSLIQSGSCVENSTTHLIYCFGGVDEVNTNQAATDRVVVYNPALDQVRTLTTVLPTILQNVSCAEDSLSNKIYCFGGYWQDAVCVQWDDLGFCVSVAITPAYSDQILEFDPTDESIAAVASLPAGLDNLSCVENSDNHHINCFGETDAAGGQFGVIEFTPADSQVTVKNAELPAARVAHSCAEDSATHMVYCLAGVVSGSGSTAEILQYNPTQDSFTSMPTTLPSSRRGMSCVEDRMHHDIYCFGGAEGGSTYFNSVLRYRPQDGSMTTMNGRFSYGRYGMSCAQDSSSGGLYCFGGGRNVVFFNEITAYWP